MNSKPKAIDLFSGCGGLTLGLKNSGFKVIAASEILEPARITYSLNHPEVYLYGDIKTLSGQMLLSDLKIGIGDLDLLAGCPPCQGFSRIRTKNKGRPADDNRNELIFDFLRIALEIKPKTILLENVPGLLRDKRMLKTVCKLKKAGYDVALNILNAADFGVPQRRKRMIMVASLIGDVDLPQGKSPKSNVYQTINKLPKPGKSGIYWHDYQRSHSVKVMNLIKRISKDGGSRCDLGKDQLECHRRLEGFRDVYGRMAWNKVSPTLTKFCTNPSKGRFLHPDQDRAITSYEAWLLQTFPKDYIFPNFLTRGQIDSMIGEALPPLFAKAQGDHIKKLLYK